MITNDVKQQLIQSALHARKWSYSPYSHYAVGAALLSASGKVYDGVNVENAVYPVTICAERVAVFKAVSEGEREFEAIAIATENGGMPCGSCRQVLIEFGPQIWVIVVDKDGKVNSECPVSDLLPGYFSPVDLVPNKID
jgi:cytidine deaminase